MKFDTAKQDVDDAVNKYRFSGNPIKHFVPLQPHLNLFPQPQAMTNG